MVSTKKMFHQFVFVFFFTVGFIQCEEHKYAHGPFGKAHLSVEIPNPFNCNRSIGLISRSKSVSLTDLNVSSANYSNGNMINVTSIPLANPCKDDFIGIYFIEVPVDTDKLSFCLRRRFQRNYYYVLVIMLTLNLFIKIRIIQYGL